MQTLDLSLSRQFFAELWSVLLSENSCTLLFSTHPAAPSFVDQYAFRPTRSTTAALIALLQTIADLMATDPFVIVIALDFSKAFDTVRHNATLNKMALLNIPDAIYNWLVNFFNDRKHCTVFKD